MAIHDVDRSPNRDAPMPNTHDTSYVSGGFTIVNQPRQAHGTNSVNYVTDATTNPATGTNTGTAGGGSVVKAGFKKTVLTTTFTLINDGSTLTTATLSHGLSYVPFVEMYFENATLSIAGGTATGATVAGHFFTGANVDTIKATALNGGIAVPAVIFNTYVYAFADATNIYVNFLNATGSPVTLHPTILLYQVAGS